MQTRRVDSGIAPCSFAMTPIRQVSDSDVSTPAADRYARSPRLLRNTAGSTSVCSLIAMETMQFIADCHWQVKSCALYAPSHLLAA